MITQDVSKLDMRKNTEGEEKNPSSTRGGWVRTQIRQWREEMDPMSTIFVVSVYLFFGIFLLLPLIVIVSQAFIINGVPSLKYFINIFTDSDFFSLNPSEAITKYFFFHETTGPETSWTWHIGSFHWNVIMNTLFVALGTTVLSTILGIALGYMVVRYDFRGKGIIRQLLVIPLIIPPFVSGIGVKQILFIRGSVFNILYTAPGRFVYDNFGFALPGGLFLDPIQVEGLLAVIIVQSLHFYTLVYLNASSAFSNIDPTMEEQAENLGASHSRLFRTVTFPLALPGISAGAILAFILSIEDVGTPIIFQLHEGPIPGQVTDLLTFKVYDNLRSQNGTLSSWALALSVILLAVAILGFLVIRQYVGLRQYAMISKGGTFNPRTQTASRRQTILFYVLLVPLLLLALTPHAGVLLFAFGTTWEPGNLLPNDLTVGNFLGGSGAIINLEDPFAVSSSLQAIFNTLWVSGIAVVLIAIFGVFSAYVLSRKNFPSKAFMDTLVTMPIAVPGIVLGAAYFSIFSLVRDVPIINILNPVTFGYPGPLPLLVFSFTIRRFPFTVRATYAGLEQTHVTLEEASLNLGASQPVTLRKITIPLIAASVFAGCLMSFVYSMAEVSTSITLIGDGGAGLVDTIPTMIAARYLHVIGTSGVNIACALGVLLMAAQIIAIIVANRVLKERAGALVGL